MRVTAEFIYDEAKILLRLLGTITPATNVQIGTYTVAFTPTRIPYTFDIEADQVVNNEVNVYISNINPFPDKLSVTLPDTTVTTIFTKLVKKPPKEKLLVENPIETVTPREPAPHNPSELPPKAPEVMSPPQFPPYWFELLFTKANPLSVGAGMGVDPIVYTGGGPGRILSSDVAQEALDQPPYTIFAPTFLEGGFTSDLPNVDFSSSYSPTSGSLDPYPTGWDIQQSDPDSLIRVAINPTGSLVPNFEIQWTLRPGYTDYTLAPPITIETPPVAANKVFKVVLIPGRDNVVGSARLVSATSVYATSPVVLNGAVSLVLDVSSDPGPVFIEWQQLSTSHRPQVLSVLAPIASDYPTLHTWINYPETVVADEVKIENLSFDGGKYSFGKGYIRLESQQENALEPLSWSMKFTSTSQVLLQVVGGILSSDFSTSTVDIRPLLNSDPSTWGNYKITWEPGQSFKFITALPESADVVTTLAFMFDIAIPDNLLEDTLEASFTSYLPGAGSSRIGYFSFRPAGV